MAEQIQSKSNFSGIINLILISVSIILPLSLTGCVASSSYYSARTLEQDKFAIGVAADDIVLGASNPGNLRVGISKDLPFAPSLSMAYGLPLGFETGLRWYPVSFLELSLRDQLNPRDFRAFDFSLDFSYAGLIGSYSYIKAGASISRDIDGFEPFLHYYFYHTVGKMRSTSDNAFEGFITNLTGELINDTRTIGFGIAVPAGSIKFFPEADYQYFQGHINSGIWHAGIGVRIYTN